MSVQSPEYKKKKNNKMKNFYKEFAGIKNRKLSGEKFPFNINTKIITYIQIEQNNNL